MYTCFCMTSLLSVYLCQVMSPQEKIIQDRLIQQDKLRQEHRKEEAQIRQEKLNLLQQEEALITKQEEMLRQIETEREKLRKQEDMIRYDVTGLILTVTAVIGLKLQSPAARETPECQAGKAAVGETGGNAVHEERAADAGEDPTGKVEGRAKTSQGTGGSHQEETG